MGPQMQAFPCNKAPALHLTVSPSLNPISGSTIAGSPINLIKNSQGFKAPTILQESQNLNPGLSPIFRQTQVNLVKQIGRTQASVKIQIVCWSKMVNAGQSHSLI